MTTPQSVPRRRLRLAAIIAVSLLLLLVIVHVSMTILGAIHLGQVQAAMKAAGLPMEATALPRIAPADNAARLYMKAFVLLTVDSGNPYGPEHAGVFADDYRTVTEHSPSPAKLEKWSAEDIRTATATFDSADFASIHALLVRASQRPDCAFDLDLGNFYALPVPMISAFHNTERTIIARARLLAFTGREAEAWQDLDLGFAMSAHEQQMPLVMAGIGGMDNCSTALTCLRHFMESPSQPQERAMIARRLAMFQTRNRMLCDEDIERLNFGDKDFAYGADTIHPDPFLQFPLYFFQTISSSWLGLPLREFDQAHYDETMMDYRSQLEAGNAARENWLLEPFYPRSTYLTGMVAGTCTQVIQSERAIALAALALAIEQFHDDHAVYPDTLAALDVAGQSLANTATVGAVTYTRTGNGWRLDGVDPAPSAEFPDPDWLHWGSSPRTAQERP